MARVFALTGTPGTGKTTVARAVAERAPSGHLRILEVADLDPRPHRRPGARSRRVDMARSARVVRALRRARGDPCLVVGHLSHLLPVRDVLLLRCRPSELRQRLARRAGPPGDVEANVEAELVDVILLEAVRLRRRIYEVDTTDRSPASVAAWALRVLGDRELPQHGLVDWLATEGRTPRGRGRGRAH